jgi:hypothetical protein
VCRGALLLTGANRAPEGERAHVTGTRALTALRRRHAARAAWRGEVELEPGSGSVSPFDAPAVGERRQEVETAAGGRTRRGTLGRCGGEEGACVPDRDTQGRPDLLGGEQDRGVLLPPCLLALATSSLTSRRRSKPRWGSALLGRENRPAAPSPPSRKARRQRDLGLLQLDD